MKIFGVRTTRKIEKDASDQTTIEEQTSQPGDVLSHEDGDFVAGPDGGFTVPQHVGQQLIKFPHFSLLENRNVKSFADAEESDLRTIVLAAHQRIDDLESTVKSLVGELIEAVKSKTAAPAAETAAPAETDLAHVANDVAPDPTGEPAADVAPDAQADESEAGTETDPTA